jgi:hypothetical protein
MATTPLDRCRLVSARLEGLAHTITKVSPDALQDALLEVSTDVDRIGDALEPEEPISDPITAVCGVKDCKASQTWVPDIEYAECPEGWGQLVLSDAQGELQSDYVCPEHLPRVWAVFNPGNQP